MNKEERMQHHGHIEDCLAHHRLGMKTITSATSKNHDNLYQFHHAVHCTGTAVPWDLRGDMDMLDRQEGGVLGIRSTRAATVLVYQVCQPVLFVEESVS